MKRKILAFSLAIVMIVGIISMPKTASANYPPVWTYQIVDDWTDVNGCHIHAVKTYGVDIFNQITLIDFQYSNSCYNPQ